MKNIYTIVLGVSVFLLLFLSTLSIYYSSYNFSSISISEKEVALIEQESNTDSVAVPGFVSDVDEWEWITLDGFDMPYPKGWHIEEPLRPEETNCTSIHCETSFMMGGGGSYKIYNPERNNPTDIIYLTTSGCIEDARGCTFTDNNEYFSPHQDNILIQYNGEEMKNIYLDIVTLVKDRYAKYEDGIFSFEYPKEWGIEKISDGKIKIIFAEGKTLTIDKNTYCNGQTEGLADKQPSYYIAEKICIYPREDKEIGTINHYNEWQKGYLSIPEGLEDGFYHKYLSWIGNFSVNDPDNMLITESMLIPKGIIDGCPNPYILPRTDLQRRLIQESKDIIISKGMPEKYFDLHFCVQYSGQSYDESKGLYHNTVNWAFYSKVRGDYSSKDNYEINLNDSWNTKTTDEVAEPEKHTFSYTYGTLHAFSETIQRDQAANIVKSCVVPYFDSYETSYRISKTGNLNLHFTTFDEKKIKTKTAVVNLETAELSCLNYNTSRMSDSF